MLFGYLFPAYYVFSLQLIIVCVFSETKMIPAVHIISFVCLLVYFKDRQFYWFYNQFLALIIRSFFITN